MANEVQWYAARDTREKPGQGWSFDKRTRGCLGTKTVTLRTGDYTVLGLEDVLAIERKACASEWHQCLFQERERFCAELDRMKPVPLAYVLLEFPLADLLDYPRIPSVPPGVRKKIQVSASLITKTHAELEISFPWVRFVPCGDRGRQYAACLMKRAVDYARHLGRVPSLPEGDER